MSIMEKLAKIQQAVAVPKGQYNAFGKYAYRTCEDILAGAKKASAGLSVAILLTDELVSLDGHTYIKATATLCDGESDQRVDAVAFARESSDKKGMDPSQMTGSASSYARKYALCGLLAIDGEEDPDARDNRDDKGKGKSKGKSTAQAEKSDQPGPKDPVGRQTAGQLLLDLRKDAPSPEMADEAMMSAAKDMGYDSPADVRHEQWQAFVADSKKRMQMIADAALSEAH